MSSSALSFAAVLPEERVDMLYHRYDGGGLKVDGTSVLVRKNVADKVSISGNYFIDNVSSASIDVVTQASKFSDKRTEKSLNLDYLFDRTLLSGGYINSSESDYISKTWHADLSQDFFGDLTTFSMGYTRGNNTIKSNSVATFEQTSLHQEYRLGLSQILTRNLIVSASEEIMVDDGFLSNPYRSFRYASATDVAQNTYHWQTEVFPNARTSYTTGLHARYHLPNYRAAIYGNYRYYTDGWDMKSHTFELGYNHTLPDGWLFDVHTRYYKQSAVNFYSDLFERADQFQYMTRDKQLSDMHSIAFGAGVTYEMPFKDKFVDKLTFNLFWDHIKFDFSDFRDARVKNVTPGSEPTYSYDADVLRMLLTVWY
ncbi:MAG TPA: DUF3570 domain-containing protein [Spongiibacteraceae bacterium]|nr:DUF3570 domain-containing protein [Spongiibacteraceae bacterium]